MRIAILTNSKLSVPAMDFLAGSKQLVCIGVPAREDKTEDADHVAFTAAHHQVPLAVFAKAGFKAGLNDWLAMYKPDVVLVFTFPFKIPTDCLDMPVHGFINFHFGLLPEYRGADAVFWQIRNRAKEGGISVHRMTSEIDRGALYFINKLPLSPADTYGSHVLNLSMAGIAATEKLLQLLQSGALPSIEQDESKAAYYARPALQDVVIDWERPAADIIALINACNPWNKGGVAYFNQYPLKIVAASAYPSAKSGKPGTIALVDINKNCVVYCGSGESINLDILYCNDSFITGFQFASMGISQGMSFDKLSQHKVA
jgi:methionyl-tRNA formyltransferase